jgi:hypothetical protein
MFNEGRTNVHVKVRSGRPTLIPEDSKNTIDQHIRTNGVSLLMKFMRNFPKLLVCRFMKLLRSVSTKLSL